MTEIEAIEKRHSVRKYLNKPIEKEKVDLLKEKISSLNQEGKLHLQLLEDAGDAYNRLLSKAMGLGSAPSVIACVGPDDETVEERIGYFGEALVLYAQQLGLNTCWAGTFQKKGVAAKVGPGERLVITIAIGYGENSGRVGRKSKTPEQVTKVSGQKPAWFDFAVKMALLAPTAINQQKFEIVYNNGAIEIEDKGGIMSKIDLGIVKYHFDIAAEYKKKTQS